jgi:hypothetical protein
MKKTGVESLRWFLRLLRSEIPILASGLRRHLLLMVVWETEMDLVWELVKEMVWALELVMKREWLQRQMLIEMSYCLLRHRRRRCMNM